MTSTHVAEAARDASSSLVPVQEIEPELEQTWYTLEEKAQEEMMMRQQRDGKQSPPLYEESKGADAPLTSSSSNPFRMLNKKDKEHHQNVVNSANLDVKRVKYSYKQTSPSGEHGGDNEDEQPHQQQNKGGKAMTTSPFQPSTSGKEGARANKGARRPGPQGERARQPPTNR